MLEEVPEGANALIEADGVICKVPGSNLGGGNSIPTAILKANLFDDSVAPSVYHATCENMTFDEVKAIFTSGGSMNARLLTLYGVGEDMTVTDSISIGGAYRERVTSDIRFATFCFVSELSDSGVLVFYWGPDGTITTKMGEVVPK